MATRTLFQAPKLNVNPGSQSVAAKVNARIGAKAQQKPAPDSDSESSSPGNQGVAARPDPSSVGPKLRIGAKAQEKVVPDSDSESSSPGNQGVTAMPDPSSAEQAEDTEVARAVRTHIRQQDVHAHGPTPKCPGCKATMKYDEPISHTHTAACKVRLGQLIAEAEASKIELESAARQSTKTRRGTAHSRMKEDQRKPLPVAATISGVACSAKRKREASSSSSCCSSSSPDTRPPKAERLAALKASLMAEESKIKRQASAVALRASFDQVEPTKADGTAKARAAKRQTEDVPLKTRTPSHEAHPPGGSCQEFGAGAMDDDDDEDNVPVRMKQRSKKEMVVAELLCRWWYALPDWPPTDEKYYEDQLKERGLRKVSLQEWEWAAETDDDGLRKCLPLLAFRGLVRDSAGVLIDLRPKETCPCYNNMMRKDLPELYSLLVRAYKKQLKDLQNSRYDETELRTKLQAALARVRKKADQATGVSGASV